MYLCKQKLTTISCMKHLFILATLLLTFLTADAQTELTSAQAKTLYKTTTKKRISVHDPSVVFNSTDTSVAMVEGGANAVLPDTIRSAAIVFSTVPILIVYPFLQKYFVQGVMIGAVKE